MKLGSLFDGIGGALLCAKRCGIEPVWASEIEPFPIKVTEHHFPEVKHLGDITKINGAEIEPVDIIVGGSPCQDLSVAGKRAGMKHADFGDEEVTRSGLFMDQIRIVKEMRNATDRPRYMVWENVPGAFSSNNGEDFRAVLEETARVADPTVSIPRSVTGWANAGSILGNDFTISWRTFDAQYWGVPQRRRRIYLVADFGGQSAPEILFESESLSGDSAESQNKRQGVAKDAERSLGNTSRGVSEIDVCYGIDQQGGKSGANFTENIAPTMLSDSHGTPHAICVQDSMIGRADKNGPQGSGVNEDVSFTLNTTDRHAVCYGVVSKGNGEAFLMEEKHMSLSCGGGQAGQGYPAIVERRTDDAICYGIDQQGGKGGANYTENVSPTILSESHGTPHAVCYNGESITSPTNAQNPKPGDPCHTLGTDSRNYICYGISAYESNGMKSSNPHSGIYEADTSRTLDQNGGNPACNQGGIAVVEPICFEPRSQDGVHRIHGDISPTLNTAQGGQRQPCIATGMAGNTVASTLEASFASKQGLENQHVNAGCPNFINQPKRKGVLYGQTKETNTREILQLLQQETGEKDLSEWGFRVLTALQSQKILRQEMYGKVVLQTRNGIKVLGYDALEGKAEEVARRMRDMSEAECKRCSPQRRKPSEQLTREFTTYMSELSQQDSPKEKFVQDMWEAGQGTWILREALPEIQKIWESICVQKKSTYAIGSVRRLTAKECCRLQGYPDGYTNIPGASDSARYKALGNSFAIPNAYFVISNISNYKDSPHGE